MKHTAVTLKYVKEKCKRKNSELNNKLHWFSSKFSIYFSYIFIKLGFTADLVTFVFFVLGLIGVFLISSNSILISIMGYVFFRLHIIVDMSDGDVARFNKSFSIRGSYWDSVIHSVLNPLYYLAVVYSFYVQFEDIYFVLFSPFVVLSSSILMSVKNNYYKALFQNNRQNLVKELTNKTSLRFKLFYIISEVLSIEGFLFTSIFIKLIDSKQLALIHLITFFLSNITASLLKFYQYSYKGYVFKKS